MYINYKVTVLEQTFWPEFKFGILENVNVYSLQPPRSFVKFVTSDLSFILWHHIIYSNFFLYIEK